MLCESPLLNVMNVMNVMNIMNVMNVMNVLNVINVQVRKYRTQRQRLLIDNGGNSVGTIKSDVIESSKHEKARKNDQVLLMDKHPISTQCTAPLSQLIWSTTLASN